MTVLRRLTVTLEMIKFQHTLLALPFAFNMWYIILIRTNMQAIPQELKDSARVDGASDIRVLVQIIVPADFTVRFARGMGPAQREALREELGLNLPLWQQYLNWMGDFVTGKLGTSFYGNDVIEVLKQTVPLRMLLFIPGVALA